MNLEKVIWLKDGMAFDETDGHVDDVFCQAGVVAPPWTDDVNNPHYKPLKEAYDILSSETDARDAGWRSIRFPFRIYYILLRRKCRNRYL